MKRNINHHFVNELKVEIEDIVTLVCMFKEVKEEDKEVFQTGRKSINYVKHKRLRGFQSVEQGELKLSLRIITIWTVIFAGQLITNTLFH